MMQNTLQAVPNYTLHRVVAGTPVVADTSTLADLHTAKKRNTLNCRGFKKVRGLVKLSGGTTPAVSLQLLERVRYTNASGTAVDEFVPVASVITNVGHNQVFDLDVGGAAVFLRIDGVVGAPTQVEIYVAGTLEQGVEGPY